MNLYFHKLLLNALKAVCFSVFVVKFYQKMIHHTFRYTTQTKYEEAKNCNEHHEGGSRIWCLRLYYQQIYLY